MSTRSEALLQPFGARRGVELSYPDYLVLAALTDRRGAFVVITETVLTSLDQPLEACDSDERPR